MFQVRKFFFISLIFHLLFTILHTAFVLQVYSSQCVIRDNCRHPANQADGGNGTDGGGGGGGGLGADGSSSTSTSSSWPAAGVEMKIPEKQSVPGDCFLEPGFEERCHIGWATLCVWALLLASTGVLLAKETFQVMHSQRAYFANWENWVQLGIIVNVVLVSFHRDPSPALEEGRFAVLVERWQHHAAAVGVFLVWSELMLMIGRLPTFGIYVQMFTTVAKNFAKFLAAYFCLLVAFALSFCVLFPNYQSFNVAVPAAIVKTLVMMAGEIEYENIIYENGRALFGFTGHAMLLIFTVLVSIVLMNLLVGLAVSDIQVSELRRSRPSTTTCPFPAAPFGMLRVHKFTSNFSRSGPPKIRRTRPTRQTDRAHLPHREHALLQAAPLPAPEVPGGAAPGGPGGAPRVQLDLHRPPQRSQGGPAAPGHHRERPLAGVHEV